MRIKHTAKFWVIGMILSILCHGQSKCAEENPLIDKIPDEVSSIMMECYAFAFLDGKTSDILSLDIKKETGNYFAVYDGVGKIRTFSKIVIWWPDASNLRLNKKFILEKCLLPLLKSRPYGETYYTSDADKLSFDLFTELCEAKNYLRNPSLIKDQQAIIRKSESKDKIRELIDLQKVSFQDSKFNNLVIEELSKLNPTHGGPFGLYIEYFDDPSNWNLELNN